MPYPDDFNAAAMDAALGNPHRDILDDQAETMAHALVAYGRRVKAILEDAANKIADLPDAEFGPYDPRLDTSAVIGDAIADVSYDYDTMVTVFRDWLS